MFSIEELENMKNYSIMDFIYKVDEVMNAAESDADKAMRGEINARRRVRECMSEIIFLGKVLRDKISIENGANRVRDLLQEAIDNEQEKIDRAIAKYERKREELRKKQENGEKEE